MKEERKRSKGRNISGVLLLDKPLGFTSNQALQRVRAMFNIQKAGHTGSLDPLASGLLPICFGEATKFSNNLLDSDKAYEAECLLGVTTNTGDSEGQVIRQCPVPAFSQDKIERVLNSFVGNYEQIPPMYSAVKLNGQPLYKLARKGLEIERTSRKVNIYEMKYYNYQDNIIRFRVSCSKGTYIRTLAEDIGNKLGCGAHLTSLRRTVVGSFSVSESVTMECLQQMRNKNAFSDMDDLLLPIDSLLVGWPRLNLPKDAAYYLKLGQAIIVSKAPSQGCVKLFEQDGMFLGVGEILDDGRVAPKRLIASE